MITHLKESTTKIKKNGDMYQPESEAIEMIIHYQWECKINKTTLENSGSFFGSQTYAHHTTWPLQS